MNAGSWQADLDSLGFQPDGHQGFCVIHRRAFGTLIGRVPQPAECEQYFDSYRDTWNRRIWWRRRPRRFTSIWGYPSVVIQEAIANVLRHSGATALTIHAQALPSGVVRVQVADNGRGFDVNAAPVDRAHGGLGTRPMCERAEALGGTTTVDSTPGQGTRVVIELPRNDR